MIKQGLKNYLQNLKYVFTPLGVLALGVVFGLSLALPIIFKSLSNLVKMIVEVSQNTQIRVQDLIDAIMARINSLDWGNPIRALNTLCDKAWFTNTLNRCVDSISVDVTQVETYISKCVEDVVGAFIILIVFVILGFIGGYFLTKCLIRREIAKRAACKYFLVSFVDALLSSTLVALCLWIIKLWKPGVIIASFVSILLFGAIQLFEAYIVHAWKRVDVKQVVNIKNIAKLCLSNVLIFALAAVLVAIVIAITNVLVGLFVGIALLEISFIVIGLNAEAYVKTIPTQSAVSDTSTTDDAITTSQSSSTVDVDSSQESMTTDIVEDKQPKENVDLSNQ